MPLSTPFLGIFTRVLAARLLTPLIPLSKFREGETDDLSAVFLAEVGEGEYERAVCITKESAPWVHPLPARKMAGRLAETDRDSFLLRNC